MGANEQAMSVRGAEKENANNFKHVKTVFLEFICC